jgi:hypothetical protein
MEGWRRRERRELGAGREGGREREREQGAGKQGGREGGTGREGVRQEEGAGRGRR